MKNNNSPQSPTSNKDKKLAFAIFMLMVFAVVLAFSTKFNQAFVVPKRFFLRSFTAALFAIWTYILLKYPLGEPKTPDGAKPFEAFLCTLRRYTGRIPRSPIVAFVFLYLIVTLFSVVSSQNVWVSFDYFFDKVCFVFIFTLVLSLFDFKEIKNFAVFLQILGGIVAIYSVMQHLGLDPVKWSQYDLVKNRSISTFGNPDFLSAFLAMIIPFAFCYAFRENARDKGIVSLILWGFLSLVTLWTYSRAGLLAMVVGTVFAAFLLGWDKLKKHWKKSVVIVILIVIAITLVFVAESAGITRHSLIQRITVALSGKDINVQTRLYLWQAGLKAIQEKPLLGTGPSAFSIAYLPYRYLEPENIRRRMAMPESSHNLFIDIAVFSGVFALISFLAVLGFLYIKSLKCIFTRQAENEKPLSDEDIPSQQCPVSYDKRLYLAAILASITAFITHHMVSFPTYPDEMLFWILLAFATTFFVDAKPIPLTPPKKYLSALQLGIVVSAGVLAVVMVYQNIQGVMGSYFFSRAEAYKFAMFDARQKNALDYCFTKSLENYDKAVKINMWKSSYWLGRGRLLEKFSYTNEDPSLAKKLFEETLRSYKMAIRLNPKNPYPHADLARYCARYDIPELAKIAEDEYKQALELDKYNVRIMTNLALLYVRQKENKKAKELMERVVEIYPSGFEEHTNLGFLYLDMGNTEKAEEIDEKLYQLIPPQSSITDFIDWQGLFAEIQEQKRPEDKRMWEFLSPPMKGFLEKWKPGSIISNKDMAIFLTDYNNILKNRDFYKPEFFPNVVLNKKMQKLYDKGMKNLSDEEITKFNFMLMGKVYPGKVSRIMKVYNNFHKRLNEDTKEKK